MKTRVLSGAAVGVALALTLTACAGGDSGDPGSGENESGGTFRITFIGAQSGPVAPAAADLLLGMQTAADAYNADGGILGKKIEIEFIDDSGDPTTGVSKAQDRLTSGDKPDLMFAGATSSGTLAMLPVLTQNEVFSMGQTVAGPINDPVEYPYHFGVNPLNSVYYAPLGDFVADEGYEKIAFILPTGALGDDLLETMTEIFEDAGSEVVVTERFDPAAVDFTTQFQRALASDPDAIFVDSTGTNTLTSAFQSRLTAGAMDVPLIAGGSFSTLNPGKNAPSGTLENCSMPVYEYSTSERADEPALKALNAAVTEKGQTGLNSLAAMGYGAVEFAALAAEAAGSTDVAELTKAMESLELPGGTLLMYPDSGRFYSDTDHFVPVSPLRMIACDTPIIDDAYFEG